MKHFSKGLFGSLLIGALVASGDFTKLELRDKSDFTA